MNRKKVVVGMSGGVDSSVAAFLLKKEGYEVIGVTLAMWNGKEPYPLKEDRQADLPDELSEGAAFRENVDARMVAEQLDIEHHTLDLTKQFRQCVIEPFIDEYAACRTPNPCIVCNQRIKWEALLAWAAERGIEKIATGHYARIIRLNNGRYSVTDAVSAKKDQTYVLYRLTQEQLQATLMPTGEYTKEEVRQIAKEAGLSVAEKKDSQDICFIPDGDYVSFIRRNRGKDFSQPGNFVDLKGNILGRHKGLIHYTVGQRKGLGLAMGEPVFVVALRPEKNEIVIGKNDDLFTDQLKLANLNCMGMAEFSEPFRCTARIRYAHKGAACTVIPSGADSAEVVFDEPQRAVTPGQSVVFYGWEERLPGNCLKQERNNGRIEGNTSKDVWYVLGGGVIQTGVI